MKTYKSAKLDTHKNKNGYYTTYIFNGKDLKACKEVTYKLKRDSISMAKILVDNNDYNFLKLALN